MRPHLGFSRASIRRILGWFGAVAILPLALSALIAQQDKNSPVSSGTKPALSAEEKARKLRERDRHAEQVNKLLSKGKLAEAIAEVKKKLAIEREVLGEMHDDVIGSLEMLAQLHEVNNDFKSAIRAREQVLAIRQRRPNEPAWKITDSRLGLEQSRRMAGWNGNQRMRYREALRLNQTAIALYQQGKYQTGVEMAIQYQREIGDLLGENHPWYAPSLNNLAEFYRAMGAYQKAEPLYLRAMEIRKRALGENHPDYATSLNNLAELYRSMGENRRAEPLYLRAMEILKRALDENHPLYAYSLDNLALLYHAIGAYRKAEPLCLQAIEIARRTLGENHREYAISLHNLAGLYQSMGEYWKAEPLYLRAMEILKRALGENHPDYARSLSGLAVLYVSMGENRKAEPLSLQAMEITRRALGENHPRYATSLNNLAGLYRSMGENRKAEPLYLQALEIRKRALGENHPYYAANLSGLALLYQSMGENRKAESLYLQAMETLKRGLGENHPDYATSLNNLALLYESMGDYRKAEPLSLQAMEITRRALGENHPNYATSLNNLAGLYQSMGENRRTEPLYLQAMEIRKRALGENHPDYAGSLNNLAGLYGSMGEYRKAEPLYLQAMQIWKRALGENHPHYAFSLSGLAELYRSMGDYRRAEPLYLQAMESFKRALGENHPNYATSLNNLAGLYHSEGKYRDAEQKVAQAISINAHWVDDTFAVLGERQRIDLVNQQSGHLGAYLTMARLAGVAPERVYRALLDWRGAVEAVQAEERLARDRPELRETYEKLNQSRSQIASLAFRTPSGAGQQEAWTKQIETLRIEKENLERELALKSAAYRQAKEAGRLGPAEIAALIPEGTALLDLFEYTHSSPPKGGKGKFERETRLVAFVLRKGQAIAQIDLGAALPITRAVVNWRKALTASPGALDRAARDLAQLVWEPLRPNVADVKTLLVAPDGALTWFPLGALPGQKPGTYLIEEKAIGYVSSGRALARLLREPGGAPSGARPPSGLLAAGAIAYAADPGKAGPVQGHAPPSRSLAKRDLVNQAFRPLPGTGPEVERIRDTFLRTDPQGPAEVLTGSAATEGAIKQRIGQHPWRYVHLATHGFYESPRRLIAMLRAAKSGAGAHLSTIRPSDPEEQALRLLPFLRSGLALAGAERALEEKKDETGTSDPGREDGLLTAEEVAALDLRGTEMVVLSACETGLGAVASGEGVLGLQRAFHAAGARSVVASLWKVDDEATQQLMSEFYSNLWQRHLTPMEALRQAQLHILNGTGVTGSARGVGAPEPGPVVSKHARAHPRFWAAWVLSGYPGML
jgi:CHAT domain-containing protein/Tfp pilus assembly protein PilF